MPLRGPDGYDVSFELVDGSARYERLLGGGPTLLDQLGSIVGIVGLTVRRIRHLPRWIVRIKVHERGNPKVAKKITRPYPTKVAAAQAMMALSIDVKESKGDRLCSADTEPSLVGRPPRHLAPRLRLPSPGRYFDHHGLSLSLSRWGTT